MSDTREVKYDAGIVTAYGAAVKGGYTGTYEEFCEEQAGFADNAQQVAADRAAMEALVPDVTAALEAAEAEITQAVTDASQTMENKAAETIASIPSDYTALSNEVTDLKSDLKSIVATNLLNGTTYTNNKYVSFSDGILYNSATTDVTDYIDISQYSDLIYSRLEVPSGSTYIGIAFYDSEKTFISGQRCIRNMPAYAYVLQSVAVPQNAKYIIMSVAKSTTITDKAFLYDSASYEKSLAGAVDVMKAETEQIKIDIGGINSSNGWYNLPIDYFIAGDWLSYTGTSSRTYRIRTINAVSFSRDVVLLAKEGYYLTVYFEAGGYKDAVCCVDIPANTNIKVNIRRIYEDTSETADLNVFSEMLLVSSGLCGMEKYKSTFTDVTMFPRIGISGDSYSAGGGFISGIRDLTWGKNLERESGVTVDIYAKSGEAIQQWTSDEINGLPALLAGEECGFYWFAHGINGTGSAASIGTPDDMSANPKPNTFYGQYVYAIQTLQRAFPRARIVVATIVGTGYSLYQTTYVAANTAIRNIAEYCGVPLVDLADDDFYKSNWYDQHHLSNHPTAMLNAGIAHANRRLFAKCVMNNPDYFIDYGNKYKTAISCPPVAGGFITASPSVAANGETVTLNNTPLPGYHFVSYNSSDVTITNNSFVVPGSSGSAGHGTYTITGVFEAD